MSWVYRERPRSLLLVAVVWSVASVCYAQDDTTAKGINSGGYNIQQTVEAGYRSDWLSGNMNNFDTFVNLGSGVRLLDYTLEMHDFTNEGALLFDNLSFSNFGYGGDPNNVTRLHVDKNKWYDFQVLFRRDKNFWDYNLLVNPLNPASSVPAIGVTNSPHSLDTVRRMQDYNATLLPQSAVRFRLGFSHDRYQGPGGWTTDGGTIAPFTELYSETVNAYRAGVDLRLLPRTTLSFDEFLNYYKQDSGIFDGNLTYQLPGGTPVDLGYIWNTGNSEPCRAPFVSTATTPPTANPGCNGFLSYDQVGRPRNSMPTERFSFQSSYFKNFEMTGSAAYSTADNNILGFNETIDGLVTRTDSRGSTTSGPAKAKRVTTTADWSGVYSITSKLQIEEAFNYDNWRIPGVWDVDETNLLSVAPAPGGVYPSMLLPIAHFSPATCPAPYSAATCPQESPGSAADITKGIDSAFLAQDWKENTVQLKYDFSRRFGVRIGYSYATRIIANDNIDFLTAETFFPGGPGANASNFFNAARGDCANTGPTLPAGCTLNADGSITFSGPAAGNDTARNVTKIHTNAAIAGFTFRPLDALRITADFRFGYNNFAFTRTTPLNVRSYKIHAVYTPRPWASIDAAIDIRENDDDVFQVNDREHYRTYSFGTVLLPKAKYTFDLGYSYSNVYSQADVCYYNNAFGPPPTTVCPIAGYVPPAIPGLGFYSSKQHFAYGDVVFKPVPRVSAGFGYAGTFVGGSTLVINPLQPGNELAFNYQKPYGMIQLDLYKGLSYKTYWSYYAYNSRVPANNPLLAPVGGEDFNGSTALFAIRYAF